MTIAFTRTVLIAWTSCEPVPNTDFAPAGLLTFAILLLAIVVTGIVAIVQTQPLLIP